MGIILIKEKKKHKSCSNIKIEIKREEKNKLK